MSLRNYMENMIAERLGILRRNKQALEDQITQATGNEIDLPGAFEDQRREKLAEVIKELKTLEPYEKKEETNA